MISRRAARASSNFVLPSIALRVQAETSAPFPSDAASTSFLVINTKYGNDDINDEESGKFTF